MTAAMMHQRPFTHVQYCLQTHAHADHLDTSHFLSRSPGFGVVGAPRLHFYASHGTMQHAAKLLARDCAPYTLFDSETSERLNLAVHVVTPMQPFSVGPYQVIAFPANHDPSVDCLLYAITADGRTNFYGTDTAVLPEQTWQAFHQFKLQFDVVVLDHTYGPNEPGSDHLSAHELIAHAARMRVEGLLTDTARILATHIAHEGNPPHPQLAAFAAEHGYEIAYDGLTV